VKAPYRRGNRPVSYSTISSDQSHVPGHFRLLYSAHEISERIKVLGMEISPWVKTVHSETGKDVVAVAVLRGGIFFFSDLVRALSASVEIAPVRTVGYDPTTNAGADTVSVVADSIDVNGRSILLIDDICDSGRTFERLVPLLMERGATAVKSAVLVRKVFPHPTFHPTWVGFTFTGDEWLVGYGMDDRERFRNLPDVYGMPPGGGVV
jgi:hypoxanthine phosphoribosyltransferase